jgi:hypothetical protein
MPDRYKFFEDTWISKIVKNGAEVDIQSMQKGLPLVQLYDLFAFNDNIAYKIPIEHHYRPDLIAYKFYRDPKLYWVLVYANEFANSPEDFFYGTIIKVPRFERILSVI